MPAVTVDDITNLPHIPLPDPLAAHERPVLSVTTAPHGVEGEGFPVRRAFAAADPRLLDPFVHMDQMGEVEYAPGEPKGTPWHPHRVIAGDVAGYHGPGITHTPISMAHATVSPGARLVLPWPREFNALVYALSGQGTVGSDARPLATGQLAVFGDGDVVTVAANAEQESRHPALDVLVLGGRPIREPVAWYGPFVMNTHAEIAQALSDYKAGKMGVVPADHIGV